MFSYERVRDRTTPQVLRELVSTVPGLDAVVGQDDRLTFVELGERVVALAGALTTRGVRPGDRVGVLLPNGARWVVAALAAHTAGASVVPMNTWYRRSELAYAIRKARMRAIVGDREIFGHDFEVDLKELGYAGEEGEFLGTFFWPRESPFPEELAAPLAADPVGGLAEARTTEASEALLLFTSGSTAEPKAVPLLQGCLVHNGFHMGERQHLVAGDRLWMAAPFFFGYGCANALPVALTHATALCLQERLVPEAALELIERERCTVYYGLAPMTRGLLESPAFGRHDISSLRTGTTGFTAEDKRLVIERLGVTEVCSVYGLTEGYGHTTMTDAHDPAEVKLETQGTVLPTQELRIVGPDDDILPAGEPGEIQLRGCIAVAYLDAPELNAEAFTDDGWFRTGDLATLDDEGRLRFIGRIKEVMKVNGINISPAEIEAVIAEHPDVDQVYVFGLSDPEAGEVIGCAVVRRDGAVEGAEEFGRELAAWARERAASYKVPRRVELVRTPDLPLTVTGKVSKRLLRERYEA